MEFRKMTLQQEKLFLDQAGWMLYARYRILGHETEDPAWIADQQQNKLIYFQMALLGYQDSVWEMQLLLEEFKKC